jgi:hypothetical protein
MKRLDPTTARAAAGAGLARVSTMPGLNKSAISPTSRS